MNIIDSKKREQENEKRKQEKFLNTRIPLNELFICEMYCCYAENYVNFLQKKRKLKFDSKRILRKMRDYYIDPTTNTKYKSVSYYDVKVGEIVVEYTKTINFNKEILERQYITIKELIALNEELNNNK